LKIVEASYNVLFGIKEGSFKQDKVPREIFSKAFSFVKKHFKIKPYIFTF